MRATLTNGSGTVSKYLCAVSSGGCCGIALSRRDSTCSSVDQKWRSHKASPLSLLI